MLQLPFTAMAVRDDVVGCAVCQRVPTLRTPIRRHVGLILVQRFFKLDVPLCREHGLATTKDQLGKTLVQGWWGIISFFVNIFVVVTDVAALLAFRRLPAPSGVATAPPVPRPSPTPPPAPSTPPGWHPDPWGRHELRWHDGTGFTSAVANGGVTSVDAGGMTG
jgi:hypothetical protein